MSKKRVQSRQSGGRQQMRQIKPKIPATAASPAGTRKQRERYVNSGGMLQGYAPEQVMRLGYIGAAGVVVGLLIMVELILGPVAPSGLGPRVTAAVAWLVPIVFVLSFMAPGVRLAWKDRKAEPKMVHGQLIGASPVSLQFGLGMIMVKTRAGNEQYLSARSHLTKVPGNQVNVALAVTPHLGHVRSISVIGQRLVARPEPPEPPILRQARLLPIATPSAVALALILGDDIVGFIPISNPYVHVVVQVIVGVGLAAAVYGVFFILQRRLSTALTQLAGMG